MIHVTVAQEVTDELVAALDQLIPQVSSADPPSRDDLVQIVESPGAHLLVASSDDRGISDKPPSNHEMPVLASPPKRRRGRPVFRGSPTAARPTSTCCTVGQLLLIRAIETASQLGATSVGLTSRPSREEANRLYQKLGFVQRDSRLYRLTLEPLDD